MMDNGEVSIPEKAENKFNQVRQLIYIQLDSFFIQEHLYEKMKNMLSQAVIGDQNQWDNVIVDPIFIKLIDILNLSIHKYYYQSLVQLQKLTYIDQQDFANEIAGVALTKTLKRFAAVEMSEERLVERFLNYLAIVAVGTLNNKLNGYWKEHVLSEEDQQDGQKSRPRFELLDKNTTNKAESSPLPSGLIEKIYHHWIMEDGHLTKMLYSHLVAVKKSLLLLEQMDQQECVEVIVSFICQHTRGKNEQAVLGIINCCCTNDNCFYQHQARLRAKFKEGIEKQKGGSANYGHTGT